MVTDIDTLKIKVTVLEDICEYTADVNLFGKCLCHAYGRDSGGIPGDDVAYVKGKPSSGGSVKNWVSLVPEGSELILSNVSKKLYKANTKYLDFINVEIIAEEEVSVKNETSSNKDELQVLKEEVSDLKRLIGSIVKCLSLMEKDNENLLAMGEVENLLNYCKEKDFGSL